MENTIDNFTKISISEEERSFSTNIFVETTTIDILNDDCLEYIFQFLSIAERIRVERVSKRWQKVSWNSWNNFKTLSFSKEIWSLRENNEKLLNNIDSMHQVLKRCGFFIKNLEFFGYLDEFLLIGKVVGSLCPNLESIDLSGVSNLIIENLANNCDNIKELRLRNIINQCEEELSLLCSRNRKLKLLEFLNEDKFNKGKFLLHLPAESLETLKIISSNISSVYFNEAIGRLKNLTELSLDFCDNLNDESIEAISKLSNLKKIQTGRWLGDVKSLNSFTKLSNLTTVEFSHSNYINDMFLISLSKHCRKLSDVNISGCNVTDTGVSSITALPNLERLNIDHLDVTDKAFSPMPNLKVIECFKCKNITSKCFSELVQICQQLELLNASYSKISNATIIVAIEVTKKRTNNIILRIYVKGTRIRMKKIANFSPLLQVIYWPKELNANDYMY